MSLTLPRTTLSLLFMIALSCVAVSLIVSILLLFDTSSLTGVLVVGILGAATMYALTVANAVRGEQSATAILLFAVAILSDTNFRQRDFDDTSADWQVMIKLALWLTLLAVAVVRFPRFSRTLASRVAWPIIAYIVVAGMSTLWSLTPIYTFAAALSTLGVILFALNVATTLSEKQIVFTLHWAVLTFVLASWFSYFVSPEIASHIYWSVAGAQSRLRGLAAHPNGFAMIGVVLVITTYAGRQHGLFGVMTAVFLYFLGIITLLLCGSRTAAGALVFAFSFLMMKRYPSLLVLGVLFGLVLVAGLYAIDLGMLQEFSRSGRADEIVTLAGRTHIWSFAVNAFLNEPFLGYGYGATRVLISENYATATGWTSTHAHNIFLQNLLSVGLLGIIFLIVALYFLIRAVLKTGTDFTCLITGCVLFQGMLESGALGRAPNLLTLVLFLTVALTATRTNRTEALDSVPQLRVATKHGNSP